MGKSTIAANVFDIVLQKDKRNAELGCNALYVVLSSGRLTLWFISGCRSTDEQAPLSLLYFTLGCRESLGKLCCNHIHLSSLSMSKVHD